MERLTEWTGYEWIPRQERLNGKIIGHRPCMERLAAYENTGITPEEIMEGKENLIKDIDFAIRATGISDHYTIGMSNGMKYVKSLIDGKTPIYDKDVSGWIPVSERLPEDSKYILLSFSNFSLPAVGRYEKDEEGGAFYLGDCDEEDTCTANDLFVNAWMPLPEPYRSEEGA